MIQSNEHQGSTANLAGALYLLDGFYEQPRAYLIDALFPTNVC